MDLDDEELKATRMLNGTTINVYELGKETSRKRIEFDYIKKEKIKEKIEELKKEYEISLEENSTKAFVLKCQIRVLEELLEEEDERK